MKEVALNLALLTTLTLPSMLLANPCPLDNIPLKLSLNADVDEKLKSKWY